MPLSISKWIFFLWFQTNSFGNLGKLDITYGMSAQYLLLLFRVFGSVTVVSKPHYVPHDRNGVALHLKNFNCESKMALIPRWGAALAHLVWPKFVMQIRPVVGSHFHFIHIYSPGAALKSHDRRQT